MSQHNLYLSQHEVSFCVWDQSACTGSFRITPVDFEAADGRDEDDEPQKRIYGLYVQLAFEAPGLTSNRSDFIYPEQLEDLHASLCCLKDGGNEPHAFRGVDGGFDLQFARQPGHDVIAVTGSLPSRTIWEFWQKRDPQILSRMAKSVVEFEFWIDPDKLVDPISEIELLQHCIRELEAETLP